MTSLASISLNYQNYRVIMPDYSGRIFLMLADGDGYCRKCEDEEKYFFDAGDGAVIGNRLSLRAVSESGGGTEDDPSVP